MTDGTAESLARQRLLLRAQLGAQRGRLAVQLAPTAHAHGSYPRSITMRWLIREPGLVTQVATWIVGARLARSLPVMLAIGRLLRTATGAAPRMQR